jgi:hypothetical protein
LIIPGGGAGKAGRIVIDTSGIDAPVSDLFTVIARHRPDLLGR